MFRISNNVWSSVAILLLGLRAAQAEVTVACVFTDHAVLQHGAPVPVWGKASPGEQVTVSYAGRSETTTTSPDGRWRVQLPALPPRLSGSLTVVGKNTLAFQDVVTGEVWLCSGQSNMSFLLRDADDAEKEIAGANYPDIREFKVKEVIIPEPDEAGGGNWVNCRPDSAGRFSAIAYFFARELSASLHRPIGIITAADGGTTVETWTSREAIERDPRLGIVIERWNDELKLYPERKAAYDRAMAAWEEKLRASDPANPPNPRERPQLPPGPGHVQSLSGHFNGMICPIIPYAIRGVLWYQGESNAPRAEEYERLCRTMIMDWRGRWNQGPFPFISIQLPRHLRFPEDPSGVSWAFLREAQTRLLDVSNTGMAITLDLGDTAELHPKNKEQFAARAALVARALAYSETIPFSGPLFNHAKFKKNEVLLGFRHADKGLSTRGGKSLQGFQIAGLDRSFADAEARIDGETVIVSSPKIPEPVAVRYAWSNDPLEANLVNGCGLPASPFRTDSWASLTNSAVIPAPPPDAPNGPKQKRAEVVLRRARDNPGPCDIVFIGDSITEQWESAGRNVWEKYYGRRKCLNLGVGGDRTQRVLWRFEQGQLDGLKPKVAVLMIGTNNSNNEDNSEGEILDGVRAIVSQIRHRLPATRVLVLGIFPRGETFSKQRGKVLQVNQALAKLEDGQMIHFLDIGSRLIERDGSISNSVMPGYLHLSEAGYNIWAEAMEPKLRELLAK